MVHYQPEFVKGIFTPNDSVPEGVLIRLRQYSISVDSEYMFKRDNSIELSWTGALRLLKEFIPLQRTMGFKFLAEGETKEKITIFINQVKEVNRSRNSLTLVISEFEVQERLKELGFSERELKEYQKRDVSRLLSLQNGANFSVPGAGKTTVTFAIHLLTKGQDTHLLVIGPKSSFMAWQDVVTDCMHVDSPNNNAEPFVVLDTDYIIRQLNSGAKRFLISYDLLIRVADIMRGYLTQNRVHVVLDESHRMKAGFNSQRGSFLLNTASLPIRRDILSGTPMPQGPNDLLSQLEFLWPGIGLGQRIDSGEAPRDVLGNLYVRTTKQELGLQRPNRLFEHVGMSPGQLALYTILRDEAKAQLTQFRRDRRIDITKARRSVMRLLQVSTNPILAIDAMTQNLPSYEDVPAIARVIREEGPSPKILRAAQLARELANKNRKSIIWTIFSNTITQLESLLIDLNPLTLHGGVPSGDKMDLETREGRIHKFHTDDNYKVIIANPAAVSEGISLHKICHEAIYVDRNYNATHFLQSIDRIHRLGLQPNETTNIYILQTLAPSGYGSIDHSVSRRLASKIRAMQQLLDDPDLNQIALDEENAEAPIDYDIRPEDLDDLLIELEGRLSFVEEEADWLRHEGDT